FRWEVAMGKELPPLKVPANTLRFTPCLPSPDGLTLLLPDWSPHPAKSRLLLLDAAAGTIRREIRVDINPETACAFSPDGKTMAVLEQAEVTLWEVASGRERGRLAVGGRFLLGLTFSPDGRLLAIGSPRGGSFCLCHLPSGKVIAPPDGYEAHADSLAFSP